MASLEVNAEPHDRVRYLPCRSQATYRLSAGPAMEKMPCRWGVPAAVYRYSIIACARWETPYIAEWISYYEAIGFDHIYLYCNDDDPAELRTEVEAATKDRPNFVSFTHFPGQGRQIDMYLAGLEHARSETEWVTFLDIDEFLVLRGCDNIDKFMEPFANTVDSVHFNWVYFGNSGYVERPPGSVLRQYTWRQASLHACNKHLARAALLDPARLRQFAHPFWHGLSDPVWSDLKRVNVLGAEIGPILADFPRSAWDYLADPAIQEAMFAKAVIHHYSYKSESDFLLRVKRGLGGQFSNQIDRREQFESGSYRSILAGMSEVEDTYLRNFSLWGSVGKTPPPRRSEPTRPFRVIRARHPRWFGNLELGPNARLRHADHGSLASYHLENGLLHVHWDSWPAEIFIERDGIFVSPSILGSPATPLSQSLSVEITSKRIDVEAVVLPVPESDGVVEIRPGTSDVDVFGAVFCSGAYGPSSLKSPVCVIVDLGANIGLSSVFFAQRYPDAKIIAVEPEAGNMRMLRRNARHWPGIVPVHAAIWPEDTTLNLQTLDAAGNRLADWAYQTVEAPTAGDAKVPALSIATLIRQHGIQQIDLLKIDIEGAEFELFSRGTDAWLAITRCVMIETHERFRPGTDAIVQERLSADFDELPPKGENRIFLRRS